MLTQQFESSCLEANGSGPTWSEAQSNISCRHVSSPQGSGDQPVWSGARNQGMANTCAQIPWHISPGCIGKSRQHFTVCLGCNLACKGLLMPHSAPSSLSRETQQEQLGAASPAVSHAATFDSWLGYFVSHAGLKHCQRPNRDRCLVTTRILLLRCGPQSAQRAPHSSPPSPSPTTATVVLLPHALQRGVPQSQPIHQISSPTTTFPSLTLPQYASTRTLHSCSTTYFGG